MDIVIMDNSTNKVNKDKKLINNTFLSAPELIKIKGIGAAAWDDWQHSESVLPRTGKKRFEPNGSWLQEAQIDKGLKTRKTLMEIERVDRLSQLATAEWNSELQKILVTKKSGQSWSNFGQEQGGEMTLIPEEALLLLEMNCLELLWNGVPLSIQQSYELIFGPDVKCDLNEYRVFSQLSRYGYCIQRCKSKPPTDLKFSNTNKRIIMNPDGLWKHSFEENESLTSHESTKSSNKEASNNNQNSAKENAESKKSSKPEIVSEETVLGSIKIVKKLKTTTSTNVSANENLSINPVSKWSGSRIQRNVKLMPKRNEIVPSVTSVTVLNPSGPGEKRTLKEMNSSKEKEDDRIPAKRPRPEIIELSDDEIEEIPRPMTRMEILNMLPNLLDSKDPSLKQKIFRGYIPQGVKPLNDFYCYNRGKLLNLSRVDRISRSRAQSEADPDAVQIVDQPVQKRHYQDRNNSYYYRNQNQWYNRNSYVQQQVSHMQSDCANFIMYVMGNMVRSFRHQQNNRPQFCQNVQYYSQSNAVWRAGCPPYVQSQRFWTSTRMSVFQNQGMPSWRSPMPMNRQLQAMYGRNNFQQGNYKQIMPQTNQNSEYSQEVVAINNNPSTPSFTKRPGSRTWSELKKKWAEERTITIEDEETMHTDEIEILNGSVNPLIGSKGGSLHEIYEKLRVIKSARDRSFRHRRVELGSAYKVYSNVKCYRKSNPGPPTCKIVVVNSEKDPSIDPTKLHQIQKDANDIPLVIACASRTNISFIQTGIVSLPCLVRNSSNH